MTDALQEIYKQAAETHWAKIEDALEELIFEEGYSVDELTVVDIEPPLKDFDTRTVEFHSYIKHRETGEILYP